MEKEITALTQLIEWMDNEYKTNGIAPPAIKVKQKAKALLETEKQQIIDAANWADTYANSDRTPLDYEKYYKEKYETQD